MTPLGEWLRSYRIENRFTLREMARRIGVSAAFMSAIETGVKRPSDRVVQSLIAEFGLEEEKANELRKAADRSIKSFTIAVPNTRSKGDAEVAALFARNFGSLNDEQKRRIREILGE